MTPQIMKRLAELSLLVVLVAAPAGADDVRPAVGHRAPDFTLRDVNGKSVQLSQVLREKAVLLNFWATWCPPCQSEMPTLQYVYGDYKANGLEILAVSIDVGDEAQVRAKVKAFITSLHLTFPALLDPRHEVVQKYRLRGLPMTFLIDRQGMIRAAEIGYRDWTSADARKKIEDSLK